MKRLFPLSPLLLACLLTVGCKPSCFAPKATPVDSPVASQIKVPGTESNDAAGTFDHTDYDALLRAHVRFEDGRVDYAGLKKEETALDEYATRIATVDLADLSGLEQKALLINAYNAFTLQLMLQHYPGIESIKDLESPWKQKRWKFAGDTLSLDDIEHGLLRPKFKDPRIHFAVNCASIGCPPLADFAFVGEKLDDQLADVTRATLSNPRYAKVDDGQLVLTKILSWYGDDFVTEGWTPRARTVPAFVGARSTETIRAFVEKHEGDPPVTFRDYNWNLNDIER